MTIYVGMAICREHGMSSATFYKWRSKYGGMDASLMARLKGTSKNHKKAIVKGFDR